MEIIRQVQILISRGELSEALNSLKEFAQGSKNYNLLIELEAQLSFNQKNILLSLQSHDVSSIERNRIIHAILEISALIEHEIVSTIEESKIYLYKAKVHSWLGDSFDRKLHLEKLKTSNNTAIDEISKHNEYLQIRISKLEQINKRLTFIMGFGFFTSLSFNIYVANKIKDFIDWDKKDLHDNTSGADLFTSNNTESSSGQEAFSEDVKHEISWVELKDEKIANYGKEMYKNLKVHQADYHLSTFLHGPSNSDNVAGLIEGSNPFDINQNHDLNSIEDFDIDINIHS